MTAVQMIKPGETVLTHRHTNSAIRFITHGHGAFTTVQGEDPEIFPFLGSSRLEEPINRFRANAVFHGHAHNGTSDGVTATGIPVYNVSAPLLRKTGKLYRMVEF